MDLHFARPDMEHLGQLKTEVLCVPFHLDEQPLRGPGGFLDWRLCGRVSHYQRKGTMVGELGEAVLMPGRPRFVFERLLWLGAGLRGDMGELHFRRVVRDALTRLCGLRVRTSALVLPGRVADQIAPSDAVEWLMEEALPFDAELDELTILDTPEAQRTMREWTERVRRRMLSDV